MVVSMVMIYSIIVSHVKIVPKKNNVERFEKKISSGNYVVKKLHFSDSECHNR